MLNDGGPAGLPHKKAQAQRRLVERLGPDTEVRTALLMPYGLVFAVGNNGSEEAAVCLTFVNSGPGLVGYDKYLPGDEIYDSAGLRTLLSPDGPGPLPAP